MLNLCGLRIFQCGRERVSLFGITCIIEIPLTRSIIVWCIAQGISRRVYWFLVLISDGFYARTEVSSFLEFFSDGDGILMNIFCSVISSKIDPALSSVCMSRSNNTISPRVSMIHLKSQMNLIDFSSSTRISCTRKIPRSLRVEYSSEYANNGNHDHKFDEGKSRLRAHR